MIYDILASEAVTASRNIITRHDISHPLSERSNVEDVILWRLKLPRRFDSHEEDTFNYVYTAS